jgi:hypothetical protein
VSGLISPEARAARTVALAAVESPASAYGLADAVVFALDAAGLLQTPEIAAELARLRGLSYDAPHVWQVWEEDGPLYGVYASQAAAEDGTIDCYRDMGESCPDHSWKWDRAGTGELLAGDEPVGIYLGRHKVRGQPEPADAPTEYELADDAQAEPESPAAWAARQIQDLHDAAVCGYVIGRGSLRLILHPRTWEEWASWQRRLAVEVGQTTYRGSVATAHGCWGSAPVTVTCHLDRLPKLTTLGGERP